MKLKLKLSKRELTLVITLGVVALSIVYYKFLVVPQIATAETLSVERDQRRSQLSMLKGDIASQDKLNIELVKLEDKIKNDSKGYFLTLNQEEIILMINEFLKDTDVKIKAVNFEEPREEAIGEDQGDSEKSEEKAGENSTEEKDAKQSETVEENPSNPEKKGESDLLDVYTASLEYESDYYSLLDFVKNVTSYHKKIMIKDININKDESGKLTGDITLEFYVIGNIIDDEEFLYAWENNPGGAVGNPFSEFSGYYNSKDNKDDSSGSSNTKAPTSSNSSSSTDGLKDYTAGSSADSKYSVTGGSNSSKTDNTNTTTGSSNSSNDNSSSNNSNNGNGNSSSGNSNNNGNSSNNNQDKNEEKEPTDNSKVAFNFEDIKTLLFVGNNKDIKGSLELNKSKKVEGESSLSIKYDFLEKRKHNMANVSFNNNVLISEQPESLSLAVNPVEKNDSALGVVIRDREGIDYKLPLTDNLDWNGWKTLSVDLPIDINYPATIERVYIESFDFYEKLTGNLLLDDLKLIYADD